LKTLTRQSYDHNVAHPTVFILVGVVANTACTDVVGSQWQGRKRKIKDEQWAWGAGLFAFEWGGGLEL